MIDRFFIVTICHHTSPHCDTVLTIFYSTYCLGVRVRIKQVHKHETEYAFRKMPRRMTAVLIQYKVRAKHNNLQTRPSWQQSKSNQSKGLHLYWHQSEGIRPPFYRVDSVLLELPYDGLID
jgi:hypothetical protein